MATYAVLGATGQTGSHILQLLLRDHPSAEINVLVRSRAKLETMLPDIFDNHNARRIHIYEGTINNIPVLTECLRGVKTAFLTVASMYNTPRIRIAQDQAEAVVAALEKLRGDEVTKKTNGVSSEAAAKKKTNLPLLVMISSGETEEDPFCLDIPWVARRFLFSCNYWIYTDLIAAEKYLRQKSDWIDTVFFKPGGIAHDIQRGHVLSTDTSQTFISFWDVAAGMIECGSEDSREVWAGKSVSVLSKGNAKFPLETPFILFKNLTGYLFPWLSKWVF